MTAEESGETQLLNNVRSWLVETGYPLEMRVAQVFRGLSPLLLTQGGQYSDPRGGTIRETDIEVLWMQMTERFATLALHLIVECKSGPQPWILFADPQAAEYIDVVFYGLAVAASSEPDDEKLVDRVHRQIENLGAPLFGGPSPACYGITQMKKARPKNAHKNEDDRDEAYDAVRQAASGAAGAVRDHKPNTEPPGFAYAVPVVVTTHPLFIASLSDDGQLEVEATNSGCLHIRPSGTSESILVHIVSERDLSSFAEVCQLTGDVFEAVELEDGYLRRPIRSLRRAARSLASRRSPSQHFDGRSR